MVAKKRSTAKPLLSAAKLKTLQVALNKNKSLRGRFIADPGEVLRAQGVEIGAAKEQQIARYLSDLTAPHRSAFEAQLLRIRIGVKVRIRIRVNVGISI